MGPPARGPYEFQQAAESALAQALGQGTEQLRSSMDRGDYGALDALVRLKSPHRRLLQRRDGKHRRSGCAE
ncbi:MAG: hypothetical protein U0361_02105 [Nitrospiraceae bacterium]